MDISEEEYYEVAFYRLADRSRIWREKHNPYHSGVNGQFVSGEGGGGGSTIVTTIDGAIHLLGQGKGVMFTRPEQAVTLLHSLAAMAKEAKAAGKQAKVYDLCKVSVKGTNLFCSQNVGIKRENMPQLKGLPIKGSPADSLPKNAKGRVDLGPAFHDYMVAQGHNIEYTSVPASHLRASQTQMDGSKVGEMMEAIQSGAVKDTPIFISKENYVIDGHHRWAAFVGLGLGNKKDIPMKVARIDLPILDSLKMASNFAASMGLPQVGVGE